MRGGDRRGFDVAIVGAGPAGAATARRLALSGCRVALIERSRFDRPAVGESLAPMVQPLLRELGVWDDFLALKPLTSYGTRSFWGDDKVETHSHLMSPWRSGWHVGRPAFDRMLAAAAAQAGAELICGTVFERCAPAGAGWRLSLRAAADYGAASTLSARLLIDASGRSARLAASVGAERFLFDSLVGVTVQFAGIDGAREGHVMIEACADGWWYSAPVPGDAMVAMLMTDSDLCGRADLTDAAAWQGRLEAAPATRQRIAAGRRGWGPQVFSAVSQRLRRRDGKGLWLAVGDAALAVDPISGSGVVRALRGAEQAARTAVAMLGGGGAAAIADYETALDQACDVYLQERAHYYGIERRWPAAPFWARRRAMAERAAMAS